MLLISPVAFLSLSCLQCVSWLGWGPCDCVHDQAQEDGFFKHDLQVTLSHASRVQLCCSCHLPCIRLSCTWIQSTITFAWADLVSAQLFAPHCHQDVYRPAVLAVLVSLSYLGLKSILPHGPGWNRKWLFSVTETSQRHLFQTLLYKYSSAYF